MGRIRRELAGGYGRKVGRERSRKVCRRSWIDVLSITIGSAPLALAGEGRVVEEIRAEAVRSSHGEEGRPLPLASHWNCGKHPNSKGWNPEHPLALIEQGHFILPWLAHPPLDADVNPPGQP